MTQEDPNAQSLIGQSLGGRFQVVKLLGEGGMGAVYLGEQKLGTSTRKVAIKTLHPHLSHDPKILARFQRECDTVAELRHPNTIEIIDFGKTDSGILYIVMEYAEGHSVADDLEKNGPMAPERVEKILAQVCGSLEEAHSKGIVHRDLKPDNILLCERAGKHDWVEVLDFGIAKRGSEHDPNEQKLTQQGTVLGTPPYMSPEQFTGKPVDARSDIYSLGVMAYEMLSGKMPFNGNTAWEWASAHMTAPPAPIEQTPLGSRVPPKMRAAIAKALEKQPENRFQSVKEFIDAFAGGASAAAPAVSAAPDAPRAKTEIGAPMPMIAGAGFGAAPPSPQTTPGAGSYGVAPAYGPPGGGFGATPSSGNQTFSAPQVRAGTQEDDGGGGKRGILIGAIAVVGVIAVGLVLFGLGVFKPKPSTDGTLGAGGPTTTLPTSTPVPGDTGGTSAIATSTTTGGPLPPLNEHGNTTTPTGKKTTPTATTSATTHPTTSTPTSQPTSQPTQQPTTPPTHSATPPPANPAICSDVPKFCNHPAVNTNPAIHQRCEEAKQKCVAAGGHI